MPIFLLALVDKGKRSDLSMAERNALAAVLAKLAAVYREGAAARAKSQRGVE